jgi:hypothetical protein
MIVTFMIMTNMTLKSLPKAEKTMESIRIHSLELGYFKMFLIPYGPFIIIRSNHKLIFSKIKILKMNLQTNYNHKIK